MVSRLMIDATQPEETRVVVHSNNRLEDYDYETASRKQLKGNIYLAKVTRVEPSLQAAFVDYGGNRHGFLPFSEIHPDYYRIPIADREALMAEEAAAVREPEGDEAVGDEEPGDEESATPPKGKRRGKAKGATDAAAGADQDPGDGPTVDEVETSSSVDQVGGDDLEEAAKRRMNLLRRYKIQEVIKRRQIILIQVSKEERGNKGAALTTYLSLAGRYCVLMPNTNKGGGISRKISNPNDRRRLKKILADLEIPDGIAVIVRTAGAQRSKAEIRRDYEYLMRLWSEIRETTLQSTAPALVHEEAQLIKRSIRDLYTRDMDDILVDGEEGYKSAKSFMKSLMPSHARKVKLYKDGGMPLFQKYQVEGQLDSMHLPTVQLPSGGYIVLNATEALVAIDVNSGKATRERNIEETALKTNLEAATEIGRQLRLRDLAGLIVIDFIDMEEQRHNRDVERRMKEALRHDRARIQLGRISHFGLLEMSRQRLRPSLFESSTAACPHCHGTGFQRTTESIALQLLRALEEEGIRGGQGAVTVTAPLDVVFFIMNQKRTRLIEIEERHSMRIALSGGEQRNGELFTITRTEGGSEDGEGDGERKRGRRRRGKRGEESDSRRDAAADEPAREEQGDPGEDEEEDEAAPETGSVEAGEDDDKPRKRRRRGKRGGRRRRREKEDSLEADADVEAAPRADTGDGGPGQDADADAEALPDTAAAEAVVPEETAPEPSTAPGDAAPDRAASDASPATDPEATPAGDDQEASRRRRTRRRKSAAKSGTGNEASGAEATSPEEGEPAPAKPRRSRRPRPAAAKSGSDATEAVVPIEVAQADGAADARAIQDAETPQAPIEPGGRGVLASSD